jgi:hypothetical protein
VQKTFAGDSALSPLEQWAFSKGGLTSITLPASVVAECAFHFLPFPTRPCSVSAFCDFQWHQVMRAMALVGKMAGVDFTRKKPG